MKSGAPRLQRNSETLEMCWIGFVQAVLDIPSNLLDLIGVVLLKVREPSDEMLGFVQAVVRFSCFAGVAYSSVVLALETKLGNEIP